MPSSSKSYPALIQPNLLPQGILGVGGTWGQINLENNCKVSISEYPVEESYFCSRGWEGMEECWLPEPPELPGDMDIWGWGLARAMEPHTGSRAFV